MLLKWTFKETVAISTAVLESLSLAEHAGLSFQMPVLPMLVS